MKKHLVEVTFDVPIIDSLIVSVSPSKFWVRTDDSVVVMEKNQWLLVRNSLQPHTAKDINYE